MNCYQANLVVLVKFIAIRRIKNHFKEQSYSIGIDTLELSDPVLAALIWIQIKVA